MVSAKLTRSAPASSKACMRRNTSSGRTSPCKVQPKAVPTPPSMIVFCPEASRAARMRASSCTTSSGVLRKLARLCAWLADSGSTIKSALPSRARSAPFKLGTNTDASSPGSVFANASTSQVSASCGMSLGGTNEPTSISR